jgi:hypothetical protein
VDAALAGLVILVIGDSQMKGLITGLHDQLEDAGAAVHSYLMCGATAQDWLIRSTVSCGRGEHHEKGPVVVSANQRLPTYELTDLMRKITPTSSLSSWASGWSPITPGFARKFIRLPARSRQITSPASGSVRSGGKTSLRTPRRMPGSERYLNCCRGPSHLAPLSIAPPSPGRAKFRPLMGRISFRTAIGDGEKRSRTRSSG